MDIRGKMIKDEESNQRQCLTRVIKTHYRSGMSNLGKEFFLPCLKACVGYRRAAGFFSSSALITWADVLPRLTTPDAVRIKLLISPQLSSDDVNALQKATDPREKTRLQQIISDQIVLEAIQFAQNPTTPEGKKLRLRLFAWMVANGHLELRFAFPKHVEPAGIFHEKIGIFDFPWGGQIAFTGSANESISGHQNNYESIDIYRSWIDADKERVATKVAQFDEAWEGHAFGLEAVLLSSSALNQVKLIAPENIPIVLGQVIPASEPIPQNNRWRHQDEAVQLFLEAGHGILEMATGTGKTRTAITILTELMVTGKVHGVIVSTDGTDLLDQWQKEIDGWNLSQNTPFRVLRHFGPYHEMTDFALNPKGAIIVISRGALIGLMQSLKNSKRSNLLIIHDEVHGLGSPENRNNLVGQHQSFGYRLGLSATPEREYDQAGTDFIESEIGPIVYKFGLKEAIERGILCEFDYLPLSYELTEDDRGRLHNVYQKKAAREHQGRPMTKEEIWTEIAKVYKTAEAKPYVFEGYLPGQEHILKSTIVFVETKEYGARVLPTIHKYTHLYRTYYADDERCNLVEFAKGKIDCLITCHRISQGIDITNLKNVVLFSSARSKLETIQRIGRCLRYDPENPTKRAKVIDFVRPQDLNNTFPNADQERCEWLIDIAKCRRIE